ncbi:tetratricopeptide repeat protein [Capilliphycus salinus ALCB114379]|uniref:tetratricopeptide repeat protein n=1 Tax=Capilliphycus salinus TaxID=2768948 RepID=UPI0039A62366
MFQTSRNLIKSSIHLSLSLSVYLLLLSELGLAESNPKNAPRLQQSETVSQNHQTPTAVQQLVNEAEKLTRQKTIPSQLEAIKKWSEARLEWQKLGDQSQEALTLLKLGEIYKNLGATAPALERYNEALSLYRELGNRLQEALTLSEIGNIYIANLEQGEAEEQFRFEHEFFIDSRLSQLRLTQQHRDDKIPLEFYQQSLKIYREINHLSGEASLLNAMASRYLHDDEEDKQELLEKSLAIYQQIGDQKGQALVLGHLSELYLIGYGNDQVGWDLFNQALALYQKNNESLDKEDLTWRQGEARLLSVGAYYWWSNNQQKTLEFYNQSLNIYQEIGDKQGEALTLTRIGDYYGSLENREKQLEFYTQALGIYQEIGDGVGEANILDRLGLMYFRLGEVEKALEFYNQELETLQNVSEFYAELGDEQQTLIFDYRQPVVLFNLANIYSQLKDEAQEREVYHQARKIYQKWQDDEGEASFLIKIAERYGKQENSEKMLEYFNHALMVYRETGNLEAEANLLVDKISFIYFAGLGDSEKGLNSLNEALKIYQKIGNLEETANTLNQLGYFYRELENKEKAVEFYSKAAVAFQEMNNFSDQAYTLRIVGELYYELGKKEQALEAFQQAGKVIQEKGDTEQAVKILIQIASDYKELGDGKIAIKFYNKAIPILQELGDYQQEAAILRTMGQLYYELENKNKAIETFNRARNVYQKKGDKSGEAWTIYEIGKTYTILGEFQRALDFYQQALAIYEVEADASFREERTLDMLIRMSRIYAYLGDSETALEYCKKSLTNAQNFPQSKIVRRSEMFREIGKLCYQIGEPEKALESFSQYGTIYQKLGPDREVVGLIRIGEDYAKLGESKQAIEFFNRARIVYQKSGFSEGEADTLISIARIYYYSGNYQQALEFFNQGLRVAQTINNRSKEASILTEIGDSYSQLKDEEKALEFYNRAKKIYQELGNYRKQTDILNKIGEVYQQFGNLEKALEIYQQALKISQENDTSSAYDSSFISINIARIYSELGEFDKALNFLQQALDYNQERSSFLYREMGKVYSKLGELEKALQFFNKSLNLQRDNYPEAQAENRLGLAVVEQQKGNLEEALSQIKIAIYLIEEVREKKNSPEERLAFFASKQDYYEFYIDLLMELHQQNPSQGYDAEALNISERSKARSLLELLAEANTDIRKGVDPQLVIQERSLQQQLDAVEQRRVEVYQSENDSVEEKTAIEQERQYLLDKYEEVQTKIRETSPSYAALTQPQPLTLEEIQQQILDDDTLLLQYALGEKRSFLWAVNKNNITSYELPPKALIEQAVREFYTRAVNRRSTSDKISKASESLSEMILAPVASQLKNKRLVIVSDGILHYLPFSALSVPINSSEKQDYFPLVFNHEIVNLPSASTLSILRQDAEKREPAPKSIAIFADPVFSSDDSRLQTPTSPQSETWEQYNLSRSARQLDIGVWERLPGTRTEAEAILALVPESETIYTFDFATNRAIATDPQLNQYKIIHFATHGLFNSVNPELSGIVLSMIDPQGNPINGFLRLHDIFNLDLSADLVVLSACKTGLGKQVRGEGLVGLTRGFMYAGTPRVLVSLWDVDDAATAEFMTRFYRIKFKENLSPTQALRRAQLEMQTDTEWKSPYYWAAFTLQGEWR